MILPFKTFHWSILRVLLFTECFIYKKTQIDNDDFIFFAPFLTVTVLYFIECWSILGALASRYFTEGQKAGSNLHLTGST